MDQIVEGIARFQSQSLPSQRALYEKLARHGQTPKALVISCSDSRVIPEAFTQSGPGDIFVVRNAGNIVPPFDDTTSGVTAAIEYAVVGLKVEHIVVCGHTECGAMKALLDHSALAEMPSVARWLHHAECACSTFHRAHGNGRADTKEAARLLAMENVQAQITHLRTHPSVAARVATGEIALHGWLFDIETGDVLALDGESRRFASITENRPLPVAVASDRRAIEASHQRVAA